MSGSLVLGFFDGVHAAHRTVISSAKDYSEDEITLLTFKDSPSVYFGGKNAVKEYILTREESVRRIKNCGVENVIEFDFSKIASMTAEEYLAKIVKEYKPKNIFTGFNHTFGANRRGDSKFLDANQNVYGYKYFCIPNQQAEGETVSSTLIKNYLRDGYIEKANNLLCENFIIEGCVVRGAQIGQKIGFPTANIEYPNEIVKIPFGVYKVLCNGKLSIMNWGMRPTVHNINEPVAEVHILNFSGDLYGQNIRVEILKQIRPEKQFLGLEELQFQIKKDISECLE